MNKLFLFLSLFVLSPTFCLTQVSMEINPTETVVGVGTDQPKFEMDIHHKSGIPSVNSHNGLNLQNKGVNNQNWVLYVNNGIGSLQLYKGTELRGSFSPSTGEYTPVPGAPTLRQTPTLTNQLATIKKLRPTTYPVNTPKGSRKVYALLAKEVQRVLPDIVTQTGETESADNLAFSYTALIPVLIAAMQEQQVLLENQKNIEADLVEQLATQQAQIDALQKSVAQLVDQAQSSTPSINKIQLKQTYGLGQNHPNPFGQQTTIDYAIPPNTKNAHLNITSKTGQLLATYPLQTTEQGKIIIDNQSFTTGSYFYSLIADGKIIATKQMVISH